MLEQIILGIIQGIVEWLPISSEGALILTRKLFFHSQESMDALLRQALFLHLGTFLAAFIYFRKDVFSILKTKKILKFLSVSTVISGLVGLFFLKALEKAGDEMFSDARLISFLIGALLLVTAFLQIKTFLKKGLKNSENLENKDSILLGLLQGFAALPGLSRSGLTVSGLLLRKFDANTSLKLSFLMSLPIVLLGNIALNLKYFSFSLELLVGLFFSFVFGLLTIDLLLRLAKKTNFGYFVLAFGILVIISTFV